MCNVNFKKQNIIEIQITHIRIFLDLFILEIPNDIFSQFPLFSSTFIKTPLNNLINNYENVHLFI